MKERIRIFKRNHMFAWYYWDINLEDTKTILGNKHGLSRILNLYPKWRPYKHEAFGLTNFTTHQVFLTKADGSFSLVSDYYYITSEQLALIRKSMPRIIIHEVCKNKKEGK